MKPDIIYYEPDSLNYQLGEMLYKKFSDVPWVQIESHNNIEELRKNQNSEFPKMKRHIIIGTRKTHKYVENSKTSDYLVPYTSSGCTAMCLYCYLVCNYNKCAYLRLFVNREKMMDKLIKTANKSERDLTFEIGSNSDLILENTITENLIWTIEQFAENEKGYLTFPTKFNMIDSLLNLNHKGRTIIRMSLNPTEIIRKLEYGTSSLEERILAINKMCEADYKIGLLIAPIVLIDNWKPKYLQLLDMMESCLSDKVKSEMSIEIIFMTYSYIHRAINHEAFPNAIELYDPNIMTGRGRGKYCYKAPIRNEAEEFLKLEIEKRFGANMIEYIV